MDGLCSGDLADITGGTLQLGTLPPLGGAWEPVRRVVTSSRAVVPGDVYWDLTEPRPERVANTWEAFARGAVGVVSTQPIIEPWAGAFVIQVPDSRRALRDVGCWARRRYRDHIVALCCSPQSPLPHLMACICHLDSLASEGPLVAPHGSTPNIISNDKSLPSYMLETAEELAIHLLHRPANQAFHVVSVSSEKKHEGNAISDLCSPHLAVINCSSCNDASDAASRIHPWLAALPTGGTAVLVHPPRELELERSLTDGIRLVRIGMTDNCDWRIREAKSETSLVQRDSGQDRIALPVSPKLPAVDLATAYVLSHLLGLDRETFQTACRCVTNHNGTCPTPSSQTAAANETNKPHHESHHESSKEKPRVPPLVSGLRESDAALPPGLKRYAC